MNAQFNPKLPCKDVKVNNYLPSRFKFHLISWKAKKLNSIILILNITKTNKYLNINWSVKGRGNSGQRYKEETKTISRGGVGGREYN